MNAGEKMNNGEKIKLSDEVISSEIKKVLDSAREMVNSNGVFRDIIEKDRNAMDYKPRYDEIIPGTILEKPTYSLLD